MRRLITLSLLACAALACGEETARDPFAPREPASSELTVCPSGPVTYGIDVSKYTGTIGWAAAHDAGVSFGITKATEGLTVTDSQFAANWSQMKSNGVIRGAYHFFHGNDDGAKQADVYLSVVGVLAEQGDLAPMLDWEDTNNSGVTSAVAIAQAQKFIDEIKLKTGLDTIVYTYPSFWQGLGSPAQFAAHPLWLAAYTGPATDAGTALDAGLSCPRQLLPWSAWSFWQWAGDATSATTPKNPYPGVSGEDLDVFNGSLDDLRGWVTPPIAQASGNAALSAVNWPDQHVELFGRSPGGDVVHLSTSGSGDVWSSPSSLGSGAACGAAAAFWGAPGLYPELFLPLANGQTAELLWSGGGWSAQTSFGGEALSNFSAVAGNDGLVRVFALGADGAIWLNAWSASTKSFAGWSSLGGTFASGASAITWGNGTIEIFATGAGGALMHASTDASQASGWSGWSSLGGAVASRPVAVRWSDGSLGHAEVFARGQDGQVVHAEFSLASGWPAAATAISTGVTIAGEPSAMMNPPGAARSGPEIFARDASGHVLHATRAGASYSAFTALGDQLVASDPFAWARADGTAEVFAIDPGGSLVRSKRDASGNWGAWSSIGSGFDPCLPAIASMDGGTDAGGEDGGADGGDGDAGPGDAGADAGSGDGGAHDGGASDAGSHDAGTTDGGAHDAGTSDAGSVADGGVITLPSSGAGSGGCSGFAAGPLSLLGLALALRRRSRSTRAS